MGHVKMETTNQGRGCHDWDYMPLSDTRVVSALIKNRTKLDEAYVMRLYTGHTLAVSGAHVIKEPVICTYIDLDKLIEETRFTPAEERVLALFMEGWSSSDIAKHFGKDHKTIDVLFQRAIGRIVKTNDSKWTKANKKP